MRLSVLIVLFCFCFYSRALAHPCATGQATQVVIGPLKPSLGFTVKGNDQVYFLAGVIAAPTKPDAGAALSTMIDQSAILYVKGKSTDRYGRIPVQMFQKSRWVQGELLGQGETLVFGSSMLEECLTALREAEHKAEMSKSGFWGEDAAMLFAGDLEKLSEKTGHFTLVQGKIVSVGDRSRLLYLNFGKNWSQDFTVSVVKKGSGAFKGNIERLAGLKNKSVRVRGMLEHRRGPLIRLNDESQIEIMD